MGEKYLIDTNVLLEYVGGSLPTDAHIFVEKAIDQEFNISIINRIEILGHEWATKELTEFLSLANTYPLTQDIEEQTIHLRKYKKIKLPDAIIVATALTHGLTPISHNIRDFRNINGLICVNPHEF